MLGLSALFCFLMTAFVIKVGPEQFPPEKGLILLVIPLGVALAYMFVGKTQEKPGVQAFGMVVSTVIMLYFGSTLTNYLDLEQTWPFSSPMLLVLLAILLPTYELLRSVRGLFGR